MSVAIFGTLSMSSAPAVALSAPLAQQADMQELQASGATPRLVRLETNGYLHILGRATDVTCIDGMLVSPTLLGSPASSCNVASRAMARARSRPVSSLR
jgi:hypothetical protein